MVCVCVSCFLAQLPYFNMNVVKIIDALLFVFVRLWIMVC